jgi:hypothetical protein
MLPACPRCRASTAAPVRTASATRRKVGGLEKVARVFTSLEDADAADVRRGAEQTPEERVAICFALRERVHPDVFDQGLARVFRVLELERS